MSTVSSIQSELKNLGAASKRHNGELSQSASKSLSILEAASQSYSNDKDAIHSLQKYEDFVSPFIMACSEASAKSCASALQCIQTLATHKGIAVPRLHELLKALMEATQLGLGIQLKILQVLPVMLYEFSAELSGSDIVDLLQVCAVLTEGNKVAVVHNTAFATLQQLINGVFDRTDIDNSGSGSQDLRRIEVTETAGYDVKPHLYDSLMILLDLCNFAEMIPPKFLKIKELPLQFTLDLLELTLSNQAELIHKHEEFSAALRFRVTPMLLRLFSEAPEFPVVLRVVRIFYLLLRQHLSILITESEVILATLASGARQNIEWKKVVCLEVLQGVVVEAQLLHQIYTQFDAEKGRTSIIGDLTSLFADVLSQNHGLLLVSDMTPEILSNISNSDSGSEDGRILSKSCVPNTPVIDMLERKEPPEIKAFYSIFLIVKSANLLTDDVHMLISTKESEADILDTLSTPLLICHSASMSIAMDMDLYRLVVRSIQRLSHAAGIANKVDLRDEFIRLLVQYCRLPEDGTAYLWVIHRCSLCVRALFNLGYALGNQLNTSWTLLTSVIFGLGQDIGTENSSLAAFYGEDKPEYRTINVAFKKLFESTTHLNDQALISLITALGSSNDSIKFKILEFVATINALRFGNADSKCWSTYANILLHKTDSPEQTFVAAETLNDTALVIMQTVVDKIENETKVDKSLGMVLQSECAAINTDDPEVRVMVSEHIFMLLEKYGANISEGWVYVLDYISSVPASNDFDLMHSTFNIVELICSDFLENLLYPQVFNLTLCLDEFSRQNIDLNTAFTATSLFWSVCDYLMKGSNLGADIDSRNIKNEKDLVNIARDKDSSSKKFALWLFAVLKLASISGAASQQQVRTSAIQIFLRLFNAHGNRLPEGVWDVANSLVFPALLDINEKAQFDDLLEVQESRILLINGLTKIITQFFDQLKLVQSFNSFSKHWMSFLENSVQLSPSISLTVYKDLISVLQADEEKSISREVVAKFWLGQNLRPQFSEESPRITAEALTELVKLHLYIKDTVDTTRALEVFTSCALFPYYTTPSVTSKEYSMSALQKEATEHLDSVQLSDFKTLPRFLLLLNKITLSPFVNELDSDKPKYGGISQWAQEKLISVIESFKEPVSQEVMNTLPAITSGMNQIVLNGQNETKATEVILKSLELSDTLERYDKKTLVESFRLILGSSDEYIIGDSDHIRDILKSASRFINILRAKLLDISSWEEVLRILLNYSVLYERSIHNRNYYDKAVCGSDNMEDALRFGTVEPALQIHNTEISFFCLDELYRLTNEGKEYSDISKAYFGLRVRSVLNQYIGDCNLLGQEPMRELIHAEIMKILDQLLTWTSQSSVTDRDVQQLLLLAVSKAHTEVLPLLGKILANINGLA